MSATHDGNDQGGEFALTDADVKLLERAMFEVKRVIVGQDQLISRLDQVRIRPPTPENGVLGAVVNDAPGRQSVARCDSREAITLYRMRRKEQHGAGKARFISWQSFSGIPPR